MTAFDNATAFFHACETCKGWDGCKEFVATDATFEAQSEPLIDVNTVQGYCDWMAGLGNGPLKGATYKVHTSAFDEANKTAIFVATFTGTHVGDGGPVPPTNKQTKTDYVYAITLDGNDKVASMRKVWNAPWALKELGWA